MRTSGLNPLIIQAPSRLPNDWVLPAMILFSLSIHALSFYLIQAAGPSAGQMAKPPPAGLMVLDATRVEHQKILAWVEARDPSVMALSSRLTEPSPSITAVAFLPGYVQKMPDLLDIPLAASRQGFPGVTSPGMVPEGDDRAAAGAGAADPGLLMKTTARLPAGWQIIGGNAAPVASQLVSGQIPSPARFLVCVGGDQSVRHIFLQESSGNEGLDTDAAAWMQALRVRLPKGKEPAWGMVTIAWGSEIFPSPRP